MTILNELTVKLSDPMWRITSGALYKIMIKGDGEEDSLIIPFIPNEQQLELLQNFHNRNIILKARQLGFTTLIAIYFLDCCLFRADVRAGMIAQDKEAAEKIFRDKVKFAYDNLPPALKTAMPLQRDSASELLFAHNNSSIKVATSMRSGTLQYLHISEFGKICARSPEKAKEVITGSIPTVPSNGVIFIESTAEGRDGSFFKMTDQAIKVKDSGKKLSKKDYKFHFFAWWQAKEYRLNTDEIIITEKDNEYFDDIESKLKITIENDQRAWWVGTRDTDFSGEAEKMWQEYPSTPEEAFQRSAEGCYYTVQMTAARKQGRITQVPYTQGIPVNTFWDIGRSDGTAVWFHQTVGIHNRLIGFIEGWGEPYSYFVAEMQKRGYVWGRHCLPHDGNHARQGMVNNLTPQQMLKQLGLQDVVVVNRVQDLNQGIQATRDILGSCWFDEINCKEGILHMDLYKKRWNTQAGCWSDEPMKDVHTEGADSFRQLPQALAQGLLNVRDLVPKAHVIPARTHHYSR